MDLHQFFLDHTRVALAFSGGVDSAYLLYAALSAGSQVRAYYVRTAFQPEFEYQDAIHLAQMLGADLSIISVDILSCDEISANPTNRCYFCKKRIFSAILSAAQKDGYSTLLDGTNASDKADDRPGMKALQEMHVLSPLRICGLTKDEIRRLSRQAGLFTWNKPSYACLATRIPAGCQITLQDLHRTEICENYLMQQGFYNFRIRLMGNAARLQLPAEQLPKLLHCREDILSELQKYYASVLLDLEVRNES